MALAGEQMLRLLQQVLVLVAVNGVVLLPVCVVIQPHKRDGDGTVPWRRMSTPDHLRQSKHKGCQDLHAAPVAAGGERRRQDRPLSLQAAPVVGEGGALRNQDRPLNLQVISVVLAGGDMQLHRPHHSPNRPRQQVQTDHRRHIQHLEAVVAGVDGANHHVRPSRRLRQRQQVQAAAGGVCPIRHQDHQRHLRATLLLRLGGIKRHTRRSRKHQE
eukprot:COSAG05_NODE_153_length_15894_cov_27.910415_15_plen_215_part_00